MKLFDHLWVRSEEAGDSLDLFVAVESMTFMEWCRLVFRHHLRFTFTRADCILFHQGYAKASRMVFLNLGEQDVDAGAVAELNDDVRRCLTQAMQQGASKDLAMQAIFVAEMMRQKGYRKA